jgi:hypothetical protein
MSSSLSSILNGGYCHGSLLVRVFPIANLNNSDSVAGYLKHNAIVAGSDAILTLSAISQRLGTGDYRPPREPGDNIGDSIDDGNRQTLYLLSRRIGHHHFGHEFTRSM